MVTQIVKYDDNYYYLNANRKISGDNASIAAKIASKQYELVSDPSFKPRKAKDKQKIDVFKSGNDYYYLSNRFLLRVGFDANKHNLVSTPSDFIKKEHIAKIKPVYDNTNVANYDPGLIISAAAKSDIKITRRAIDALKADPKYKDQSIDELINMFKGASITSKAVKFKDNQLYFVRRNNNLNDFRKLSN